MQEIKMVDLKQQYLNIKQEVDQAIQQVIDSTAFINGPDVKALKTELAEMLNVKHVVTCGNGTDALQAALMALNLEPGDEVITTDFTFIATLEVIALLQLKPVLVDIEEDSFNIDTEQIENSITNRTKAIIPVHLYGQCANMERIMEIANKHGLCVIEDAAQALGTEFIFADNTRKKAGTIGHIGCTSFFPSKTLGAFGDGGAIFTNDDKLAESLASIVNHGTKVKYYHNKVGINSRLDTLQAAILRVKLKYINEYALCRQNVAAFYDKAFENTEAIKMPVRKAYSNHVFHQYTIKVDSSIREALCNHLKSKGIPTMIYYPVPMHLQEGYRYLGYQPEDFPISSETCKSVVSLPIHTELTEEQLEYITTTIIDFIK